MLNVINKGLPILFGVIVVIISQASLMAQKHQCYEDQRIPEGRSVATIVQNSLKNNTQYSVWMKSGAESTGPLVGVNDFWPVGRGYIGPKEDRSESSIDYAPAGQATFWFTQDENPNFSSPVNLTATIDLPEDNDVKRAGGFIFDIKVEKLIIHHTSDIKRTCEVNAYHITITPEGSEYLTPPSK